MALAQFSVRVGAVGSEQPRLTAATLAPRYDWARSGAEGFVELAGSAFEGGWVGQLTVRDGQSRTLRGVGVFGSEGTLEASLLSNGVSTGRLQQAFALGRRLGPVLGSAAIAGGVLRDTAGTFRPQVSGRVGATVGPVSVKAQRYDAGASFRYSDVLAQVAWRFIAGSVGSRVFDHRRAQLTYRVDAAIPLMRMLALEAGYGQTARSPEGFSEGSYGMVGLRVIAAPKVVRPVVERTTAGVRVVLAVSGSDVSIAGDWNDWQPVPMRREAGGRWSVVLPLGPGAHKFTLTVDGKTVVPRGVPKLPDGFGGEVGLLVL